VKRIGAAVAAILLLTGLSVAGVAAPAEAHILPTTAVALTVHESEIDATVSIPVSDLELATGLDVDTDEAAVVEYIEQHFTVASGDDRWSTTVEKMSIGSSQQYGTATFDEVTVPVTLTPADGSVPREFELDYDVVLDRVATHTVIVSLQSDWAGGDVESTREIGTITENTATGEVEPLAIDLGDGSAWNGFVGLVTLGISHIIEGTDHQLFLLTLLLPAPLLVAARRWGGATTLGRAVKRIAAITLSFTVGHSITLALGTLGLPVPEQAIEALIAVSILVAAAHAVRPIFPGREALIAGGFGLIHGLAFSATLTSLDLSGGQLALSLLGFNVGIELMQLAIVALVLPPLYVLARTPVYPLLRVAAAALAGVAALGWLLARVGVANPVADVADGFVTYAPWVVALLWAAAGATVTTQLVRSRRVLVVVD
jgi:hypothetical protein